MRLTSRQSISSWCATRRVFRHRSEQKATCRNSRRHRRSTSRAAVPHPSTKLPPRKTARSDALTIEMSALEARPPTAPESWLLSGISSPPWDRSRHNLTPNITGGIRERLHTGHRPGTDSLPIGSHRAPSEQPTHNHASAELVPESGRQHRQGEERERRESIFNRRRTSQMTCSSHFVSSQMRRPNLFTNCGRLLPWLFTDDMSSPIFF